MDRPDASALLNADYLATVEVGEDKPIISLSDAVDALRRIKYHQDKIAETEAEMAALLAPLQAQMDQIIAWGAERNAERERRITYHNSRLQAYYRLNPPAKGKTLSLPGGRVSCRTPEKWTYHDEATVLSLLSIYHPELVRTKEETDKVALKQMALVRDGKVYIADEQGELHELPVTVTTETTYKVEVE